MKKGYEKSGVSL